MWAQAELSITPQYRTLETSGPDHARMFVVEVMVSDQISATGSGRSKQDAAQQAAQEALKLAGHFASDRGGT
jgi:ribonuclease-3